MTTTTNTTNTTTPETPAMVCPICGKEFFDVITYADHLISHSNEEKKRRADEEKQRKADQKKVDAARLEKLRKNYETAAEEYAAAKAKFSENYGEMPWNMDDLVKPLYDLFSDHWSRWL